PNDQQEDEPNERRRGEQDHPVPVRADVLDDLRGVRDETAPEPAHGERQDVKGSQQNQTSRQTSHPHSAAQQGHAEEPDQQAEADRYDGNREDVLERRLIGREVPVREKKVARGGNRERNEQQKNGERQPRQRRVP